MPRRARTIVGGLIYHILNRANARATLFERDQDYAAFAGVLQEALERYPLALLAYCLMPNHWHLVFWPQPGQERMVSDGLRWLSVTHARRWHLWRGTAGTGHLYQGRFKAFPVASDEHFLVVARYVERNALRARLVARAEDWPWGSLGARVHGPGASRVPLSAWPVVEPPHWIERVNEAQTPAELSALRRCVRGGRPFGGAAWVQQTATALGLTARPRGRPRKQTQDQEK